MERLAQARQTPEDLTCLLSTHAAKLAGLHDRTEARAADMGAGMRHCLCRESDI